MTFILYLISNGSLSSLMEENYHLMISIRSCLPSKTMVTLTRYKCMPVLKFSYTVCTSWAKHIFIAFAVVVTPCTSLETWEQNDMNFWRVVSSSLPLTSAPYWANSMFLRVSKVLHPYPDSCSPLSNLVISAPNVLQDGCPRKAILPFLSTRTQWMLFWTLKNLWALQFLS